MVPQQDWRYSIERVKETRPYQLTVDWLDHALSSPGIWLLVSEPGTGKTWGVTAYADQHHIPLVTPLTNASHNTHMRYIARAVLPDYEQYRDPYLSLLEWCASIRRPKLIIDEAGRLPRTVLDALRDLTDRTPLSMVWVGTTEFVRRLRYYDTIIHRVNGRFGVPTLTTDDIASITGVNGEVAKCLHDQTGGNYRHLTRILDNVPEGVTLTIPLIHAITKDLLINKEV